MGDQRGAHHHHAALELADGVHQAGDRLHVEVVRRLVQQQQVVGHQREAAERHPRLLPAGEEADLSEGRKEGWCARSQGIHVCAHATHEVVRAVMRGKKSIFFKS